MKRWVERVKERFIPVPRETLILPCSARKPYSFSKTHRKVRYALGKKYKHINKITLTSPLGLVPEELEFMFPANCYDIPVSGHWADEEKDRVKDLLSDYVKKLGKQHVIAFVDEPYRENCKSFDIEFSDSLESLSSKIKGTGPVKKTREYVTQASMFQFGVDLTQGPIRIRRERVLEGGKILFNIDYRKGKLTLTKLSASRLKKNRVRIDFTLKSDSLFSPGVLKADKNILPGDEVVIMEDGSIHAFGEAVIAGEFMGKMGGLAVRVRKRF
jgi:archaeosine synthase